jgi:hypothetical protein
MNSLSSGEAFSPTRRSGKHLFKNQNHSTMLTILNAKDRNLAFTKFLISFVLTVALVVIAVYFNFSVPEKENELFKEEIARFENNELHQEKFLKKMEESVKLLDGYNGPANATRLSIQIDEKIRELTELKKPDSSVYAKLNTAMIEKLIDLKEAKSAVIEKEKLILELNRAVADVKSELDNCRQNTQLNTFQ